MNLLAALLLALQPSLAEPVRDRCAVIERNNFYDEGGRLVFAQWIFRGERSIIAWRLVKPEHLLLRTAQGWSLLWTDGVFRRVDALSFRETWTQYDPELMEREIYPKENRRELHAAMERR